MYDASTFVRQTRYGLGLQVTSDPTLSAYLQSVLAQLRQWLERGEVKRLVLVIAQADTEEVVERWVFNVQTDRDSIEGKQTSATAQPTFSFKQTNVMQLPFAHIPLVALPLLRHAQRAGPQ